MASRSPPLTDQVHRFVCRVNHASPDTVQDDKASTVGSFSPWSDAKASPGPNSIRTPPGSHARPYLPSIYKVLDAAAMHARHGGVVLGQQPFDSPCAHLSTDNPYRSQPRGHFLLGQQYENLTKGHNHQGPRLPGNIIDIGPSTGHGSRQTSIDTVKPATPVRVDPNRPGFGVSLSTQKPSSVEGNLGHSSSTLQKPDAAPIYYQPMSNLMATDSPGQPDAITLGGLDLNPLPTTALDRLASSMQQVGLNGDEVGPVARIQRHFSPHYQGDIFLPANQSEDIADDLNCSLFIVNLPPSLTTHELLAAIHKEGPLGRVFAIHINGPELQRNHPGCAAKVVFFKRDVAQKFFTHCELNGFRVKGYNARVMWNRIKTSEKPHLANSDASRVLLIGGPPSIVNSSTLTDFFHTKLEFQIDSIITHVQGSLGKEDAVIEFRFGSFRCQAQAAKMALARELPHIRCFFGKDPLEPEAYRPFEYFSFNENI